MAQFLSPSARFCFRLSSLTVSGTPQTHECFGQTQKVPHPASCQTLGDTLPFPWRWQEEQGWAPHSATGRPLPSSACASPAQHPHRALGDA